MTKHNNTIESKYFHCYATANDSRLYFKDIQNLMYLKDIYSGCKKLILYIAISEVKKINSSDALFIKMAKNIFFEHPSITLKEIYFKSNIGRDFSSFQSLFQKVKKVGNPNDYILFQNRSGYGPFRENWYKQFVEQFEKFESIAICGSTINFSDNPKRSLRNDLPHVQTYSFLTKLLYFELLKPFPGSIETDKTSIINNGEIGLSQFFLERNYKITCMEWPNEEISKTSKPIVALDLKEKVTANHYFYHRNYFKKNMNAKIKQIWLAACTWINFLSRELKN
jgi:hypothetical protein